MKYFEEKDIPLVQQYLAGGLSGEEKKDFEQRLADPRLQNELEWYKAFFSALEDAEDQRRKKLLQARSNQPAVLKRFRPWVVAAGFLLVVAVGALIWTRTRADVLFESYSLITAAPDRSGAVNTAYSLYEAGQYREALAHFEAAEDSSTHFLFYKANCLMALDKDSAAIPYLQQVEKDAGSILASPAKWYLALAYYRTGNREQAEKYARKTLDDPGSLEKNKKKAGRLLEELR